VLVNKVFKSRMRQFAPLLRRRELSNQPDSPPAPGSRPPTEQTDPSDLYYVLDLIEKMDNREAKVLRMRFGLDADAAMTFAEIGERLGLTSEQVGQIESESLAKLSEAMHAD
jgi:RNA polymerase sigma factor (sigma-70 family)